MLDRLTDETVSAMLAAGTKEVAGVGGAGTSLASTFNGPIVADVADIAKRTVVELRALCKAMGLSTSGLKKELIERLEDNVAERAAGAVLGQTQPQGGVQSDVGWFGGEGDTGQLYSEGAIEEKLGEGGRPVNPELSKALSAVLRKYHSGADEGIFTDGSCEPNPGPGGY